MNPLLDMQGGPPEARAFGDVNATRAAVYQNALTAAQNQAPVSNQKYILGLSNVGYDGPETYTKADEKRAVLEGRSLGRRLRGTYQLRTNDDAQQVVDEKRVTLASIPHMTPRGTFILNGNEYSLSHQMRLRPGIFTRIKESGELESHVNVARGFGHRYFLDPETGIFRIQFGQARMPLMPVLKALGATDRQIRDAWGNELFVANAQKSDPGTIKKLYKKLVRRGTAGDDQEMFEAIRAAFDEMELDPEVTKRTLGKPYAKVDPEVILSSTQKLLRVHKGEEDADDRDAMAFQRTVGPEDLFAERINKAAIEARKALWKATLPGNLSRLQPNIFQKMVRGAILETGLGNPLEEINPAELYDQRVRVTRMGEGGIPSSDSVPDEARNVQPSHLGFIDPVHTPESGKIGIDSRLSIRTLKGPDGRIYSRFLHPKTGKTVWKSPQDVADAVVAFPGELESGQPHVRAQHKGKLKYVAAKDVDYQLADMTEAFGPLASMVPLKGAAFPQRVSMGSRMLSQALPMADAEAPLVQSGVPGMEGTSFEDLLGSDMGAVKSQVDGTVLEVTPSAIKIRGKDRKVHYEELYDNHPYNRKTFVHNRPVVRPGDKVRSGQLLASSNFTDQGGTTALGKNARVAYLPYKGYNFEDAIVISESFAKRASSEHMYQHELDIAEGTKASKNTFMSIYPGEYDRKLLEKYDDDGVVRVGETVNMDEPLILAVKERKTGPRLGRRKASWSNASIMWDHHSPGTVTDVHKGKKGISVVVKSLHPTQVGDKFAGRYGDKGVVAAIVPDEDMPHGPDKVPYEVLLNPGGIMGRGNPSQIIEAQLGKIAALTGKPYKLQDFGSLKDLREFAERELRKHGLPDTEDLTDPKTGRTLKDIDAGNRFIMKLHHTAEAKLQGRAAGGGYTAEGQPAKGGPSGSKRVGMLELNALLSHGAYKTIRDASIVRGQRNEDYWRMLMSGYTPPEPKVPFMFEKFVAQLKGAGINPVKTGTQLQVMAMTGPDAVDLTGDREIQNAQTVDWRISKLTPIKGGLFDESLTGGHGGNRWSHIKLHEPLPNPVMEEPIRRILGLTQKQFESVLAGREGLPGREQLTGPAGIKSALEDINLNKEIERARAEMNSGKKTYRDKAIRRLQYLKSAKENGQHPGDWMMDRVPVLPPTFRPVSLFADTNTQLVNDANYLYKEVFEATKNLKDLSKLTDDITDERLAVYKAFKGVTGLGNPISPEFQEQDIKGILKHVFGSSPKFGTVQRKLLGSTVDLVGRATITPNPNLDMDQVGLPIDEAWTLYQPFIVRRLVRRGMGKIKAMEEAKERTPLALRELQSEMQTRPVVINRAPVLHRFGVMAFWPQLTSSSTLEIPPLTVGGFGADFDGDAMQFHVPSSDDAVDEAKEKLMPSKNLLAVGDFDVHYTPSKEYVGGLWAATAKADPTPARVFKTKKDAIAAYHRGEIGSGQRVEILE